MTLPRLTRNMYSLLISEKTTIRLNKDYWWRVQSSEKKALKEFLYGCRILFQENPSFREKGMKLGEFTKKMIEILDKYTAKLKEEATELFEKGEITEKEFKKYKGKSILPETIGLLLFKIGNVLFEIRTTSPDRGYRKNKVITFKPEFIYYLDHYDEYKPMRDMEREKRKAYSEIRKKYLGEEFATTETITERVKNG